MEKKENPLPPVFWLIRHGQRYDEVPGNDWDSICQSRWFDPPLTVTGGKQAHKVGQFLVAQDIKFSAIYVSPLLRTMQTAEPIGRALNLPLQPVFGISHCAAAVEAIGLKKVPFLTPKDFSKHCPTAKIEKFDTTYENFTDSCSRLAQKHMSSTQEHVIIVTHREGIRDMTLMASGKRLIGIPYCAIAKFQYIEDDEGAVWAPWVDSILAKKTDSDKNTSGKSGSSESVSSVGIDSIESNSGTLSSGTTIQVIA